MSPAGRHTRWAVALLAALLTISQAARAERQEPGAASGEPAGTAPRAAPAPAQNVPAAAGEALVTDTWREPEVPLDAWWHLLAIPERLIQLAFTPAALLVTTVERYRLDRRFDDWRQNDAGTIVASPRLKLSFGDGLGLGARLSFKRLLQRDAQLAFESLGRLNLDWELGASYEQSFAELEGRNLELETLVEVDRNLRYFGIGADTTAADERVLRSDAIHGRAALDLAGRGIDDVGGQIEVGWRHERLGPGDDPGILPVAADGDMVPPPPGFGQTLDYPHIGLTLAYDTRDTEGRPRQGMLATVSTRVTSDIDGANLNAIAGRTTFSGYLSLLPRHRTLVFTVGTGMSQPLTGDGEVPLHMLYDLGRTTGLRGYRKDRFRARFGWHAGAEYRYPIYEYMATGVTLSATWFGEMGRVGQTLESVFDRDIAYSYGVGLRGAHDSKRLFQLDLGFGPEGPELALSLGSGI